MTIKNSPSSHDPNPGAADSPYRDSEDAGPVPVPESSYNAPPPYANYGSTTLNRDISSQNPFQSSEDESHYWQRYHQDMKLSRKRKLVHFLTAFIILAALFYFLGSLVGKSPRDNDDVNYAPAPSPPSQDGRISQPPKWSDPVRLPSNRWPSSDLPVMTRSTQFRLSSSSPALFLHAFGSHFGGNVEIGLSDSSDEKQSEIVVNIKAIYSDQELLDTVSVGKMKVDKKGGGEGIGLYQSKDFKWNIWDDFVDFEIKVILPYNGKGDLLKLNSWETDVDNLSIEVGPLQNGILFKDFLDLKSENGRISVRSAEAQNYIHIGSGNGRIESSSNLKAPRTMVDSSNGRLQFQKIESSTSIDLKSENGGLSCLHCISPSQSIVSQSGRLEGTFSVNDSLILSTNTGGIDAKINILDPSKENKNREVTVSATSSAGKVTVDYLEQAENVSLVSTVKANVGAASVNHAKYFQGEWKLKSKVGSAKVSDQTEADHHFKIDLDQVVIPGHQIEGRSWWNTRQKGAWGLSRVESDTGRVYASFV